jgi:mRNA-degrading endonuclease RelE of RelBE toxin-antitoxin system
MVHSVMVYDVRVTKKAEKGIKSLPIRERKVLALLLEDLRDSGPVQAGWKNYSKIGKVTHLCHISYSWVVTWRCEKDSIIVEVEYVGSRENAPY